MKGEFNEFIIHGDTAWSYVDDEVRTELENWRDHPFYYSIANYVSNRMLWYQLLGDSTYTTSKKEAIQFYVNLALEYNNPDAEMQAEAFKILHDNSFWSTSRINTAADSATDHATEYLQLADWNICNCEDSTGTAGYIQDALDAKSAKLDLIDDYLGVLDSLSNL